MTTTSSFPFSTMEVPLMDDNMEMASPYQGHVDDFDIDLDVMEDQISNPDRDMTAADDFLDTSPGPNYDQDVVNDADMIDDTAEPTMTDADEHYPQTTNPVEMQYVDNKFYEAEMLEDGYDEDIDAPVPEIQEPELQEELPKSPANANNQGTACPTPPEKATDLQEDSGRLPVGTHPKTGSDSVDKNDLQAQQDPQQDVNQTEPHMSQELEFANTESEPTENPVDDTNVADQVNPEVAKSVGNDLEVDDSKGSEDVRDGVSDAQPPVDRYHESEVGQPGEEETSAQNEEENRQDRDQPEQAHLYPVKVYYQDNEISLFPPREGDSSETFFLEDESLAYGSFGKLFESCREVLHDHVNDNEVLVVDIETLNIQITEDSLHTSKVTLHQIVDLYLQLCHNDGVEEPEALYLTLSTKLTVAAEVSDLLLAASQGKRLSEIHSWEGYQEGEDISAEFDGNYQDLNAEESHDTSKHDDGKGKVKVEVEVEVEPEYSAHEPDHSNAQQDNHEPQESDIVGVESLKEIPEGDGNEETEVKADEAKALPSGHQSPNNQSYSHVSEEQTSETTTTIDQLPGTELLEEEEEEAAEPYGGEDHDQDEYQEVDELDDESHPEEDANVDATEYTEDNQSGVDMGDNEEVHLDPHHDDLISEYYEEPIPEKNEANDAYQENDDATDDTIQGDKNTEAEATLKTAQSPLADDLLGITEDLLESPCKNSKSVALEAAVDDIEPGEIDEEADHASLLPADNALAEDFTFDDEEYLDLGITDGLGEENETTPPSHVRTKRSREPDDELELPETPTPDAKRSRST